ncbi:MAG: helicase-related protein [Candidatus Nanopelagicales bacterium]
MRLELLESAGGQSRLAARTGYAAREVMKAIPGARWNKDAMCWTYPMGYPSVLALGEAAKRLGEGVDASAEALEWAQGEAQVWGVLRDESGRIVAEEDVPGFFKHQVQTARWMALPGARGGRLDISQTGAGKTRAALRAAWLCWTQGESGILLVSTLMAVKHGWRTEIEEVKDELPLPDGREWQVFNLDNSGTVTKRRKIIAAAAAANEAAAGVGVVLLVNHEQLRTHSRLTGWGDIALKRCPACGGPKGGEQEVKATACQAHDKELNGLEYVAVVLDEVHRMLEPKAQVTRAAWAVCDSALRVWGLTGTPGSRHVVENQWALQRLAYGKDWPSKSSWSQYYAECGYSALGFWEIGKLLPEHEPEFRAVYGAVSRRVLKAQVLDLPPLLRGGPLERQLGIAGEQARVYQEMESQLRLKVDEGEVTAANMLVQAARLSMLASATGVPGPNYGKVMGWKTVITKEGEELILPDIDAEMDLRMPSNKVDALVDMITSGDVPEGSVFQFVSRKLLYLVRDALVQHKAIGRAEDVGVIAGDVSEAARSLALTRFQAGKIPWFMFTVAAGGAGITLTRASVMVAVQRPWSSIQHLQAQDRCFGAGTPVLTASGWKPIESVQIGDRVISRSGAERMVLDVWSRKTKREDILAEVSITGQETVTCTGDHRFLTVTGEWVEAQNLRPGDWLATPKNPVETELIEIPFGDVGYVLPNGGNVRSVHMPTNIAVSDDFLFMFGYYIGDGFSSTSRTKVRFVSLSGHTTPEVRFYSSLWVDWFRAQAGHGAHNKALPAWVWSLSKRQCLVLLSGLTASDGYLRGTAVNPHRVEYVTVSTVLAGQVFLLAMRAGYRPTVAMGSGGQQIISFGGNGGPRSGGRVRSILLRHPRKVKNNRERVYDITVEEEEAFVTGGVVAHNCHRIGSEIHESVSVIDLVTAGSIEERQIERLTDNAEAMEAILHDKDRMKEMLFG